MKLIRYIQDKKLPIILFLVIGFLLFSRFYKITEVPTALVHDELIYVMEAKALHFTGSDMLGTWNPLSLQPFDREFAELPSVVMSLGINLTNNAVLNGKMMHLIIGMLLPFVLGWMVMGIWKNRSAALITVLLASVNPWLWQFSRMTFDSLFSLFFYILSGAIILNCKKWWKLASIPFLIIGFYQYQGLKLIFIPMIICFIAISLAEKDTDTFKKINFSKIHTDIKALAIIMLTSLLLFFYYIFVSLPQQSAVSRMSQIVLFEKDSIATEVITTRQLSINNPALTLVTNKFMVLGSSIIENTFKALSPDFIFFSANEGANRFGTSNHGYLYIVDFILIAIGMIYLATKPKTFGKTVSMLY